ncbi:hypothetical protein GCM10025867_08580 [Frondihabitans sucicola]|uniref:Integrase catalytic domain-containing protein n=1 Tax=Frondihabitans sucicola TaxID=1268041 RepID=A0ABN6XXH1_9MICO|nr:hypothetical protein [Frondihabitans sucicola]BDZ48617.1 hypothetical protein GCM10025867_08580 [Frondihabitans sucicola]
MISSQPLDRASSAAQAVRQIYVGARITWNDETAIVAQIGIFTALLVHDNRGRAPIGEFPIDQIVSAMQHAGAAAPTWVGQDPEHLLARDKDALDAYRANLDTVYLALYGVHPNDPPGTAPMPELHPKLPLAARKRFLAELNSRSPRSKGSRNGFLVKPDSERTRIDRLIRNFTEFGPIGLVHAARLGLRDRPGTEAIRTALDEWLLDQAGTSLRTKRALAIRFVAELDDDVPFRVPGVDTIADYIADWFGLQDHSGGSAATRASAEARAAMSEQVRITTHPGQLVLFDTTKVNVWVRNPDDAKRAVRLELTIALDHYTCAIVGMALTHTTASLGIALCLADVIMPKRRDFIEQWNNDPPSPYTYLPHEIDFLERITDEDLHGFLPETILSDNGSPYVSATMAGVCAYFHISFEQARSYTPGDKAQIERAFGTIKEMLEALFPGFLGGSVYERGKNSHLEALVERVDYEQALREFIWAYNRTPHEGLRITDDERFDKTVDVSPMKKWEHGMRQHGPLRVPAYALDPVRMLPFVELKTDAGRAIVKRLTFRSPIVAQLARDYRCLNSKNQLRIHYNPADMRQVYIFDASGDCHEIPWIGRADWTPQFGLYFTKKATDEFSMPVFKKRDLDNLLIDLTRRISKSAKPALAPVALLSTAEEQLDHILQPAFRAMRARFGKGFPMEHDLGEPAEVLTVDAPIRLTVPSPLPFAELEPIEEWGDI